MLTEKNFACVRREIFFFFLPMKSSSNDVVLMMFRSNKNGNRKYHLQYFPRRLFIWLRKSKHVLDHGPAKRFCTSKNHFQEMKCNVEIPLQEVAPPSTDLEQIQLWSAWLFREQSFPKNTNEFLKNEQSTSKMKMHLKLYADLNQMVLDIDFG